MSPVLRSSLSPLRGTPAGPTAQGRVPPSTQINFYFFASEPVPALLPVLSPVPGVGSRRRGPEGPGVKEVGRLNCPYGECVFGCVHGGVDPVQEVPRPSPGSSALLRVVGSTPTHTRPDPPLSLLHPGQDPFESPVRPPGYQTNIREVGEVRGRSVYGVSSVVRRGTPSFYFSPTSPCLPAGGPTRRRTFGRAAMREPRH